MKNIKFLLGCVYCISLSANLFSQTPLPLFTLSDEVSLTPDEMRFLDVLEQKKTTASIQIVSANLAAFKTSGPVLVENLSGSSSLTFRSTKTEVRSTSDFSWAATAEGSPNFTANFVWNNGFVHGNLYLGKIIYAIMPLSRERQALVHLNTSAFPPEECNLSDKKLGHAHPGHEPEHAFDEEDDDTKVSPAANCRIRLIVGFTDDVDNENADPRGHIQLAVDAYNEINENSGVFHRVELARVFEVNYAESENSTTDLANWETDGDGIMDEVHLLRNLYDADLAGLIVSTTSGCGRASGVGSEYATAFQVTEYSCAHGSAFTFAHEFGHLLGADHDPFVNSGDGTNKGRVNFPAGWRTVMAYEDFCDCSDEVQPCPDLDDRATPSEPNCPRIKHWSNPAVDYDGDPTGLVGVHENEDAIDAFDQEAANFEAYVVNKIHLINDVVADDEEANILGQLNAGNSNGVQLEFNNNSKGSIRAGEAVTLRPGFWAKQGSDFRALIGDCTNPFSAQAPQARSLAQPSDAPSATDFELMLSPNPASSVVSVRCTIPMPGQVTIELIDLFDRRAAFVQVEAQVAGLFVHELDVAGLAPGVYFLKLKSGDKQAIERLVVAK
jgi:Metallo-peptidase family M12/Secretion system C-terminal sorting domain